MNLDDAIEAVLCYAMFVATTVMLILSVRLAVEFYNDISNKEKCQCKSCP